MNQLVISGDGSIFHVIFHLLGDLFSTTFGMKNKRWLLTHRHWMFRCKSIFLWKRCQQTRTHTVFFHEDLAEYAWFRHV